MLQLNENDVFVDFGHGIGNTCLQAAYTVGCEARGIEVVLDRHRIAELFRDDMHGQNMLKLKRDGIVS